MKGENMFVLYMLAAIFLLMTFGCYYMGQKEAQNQARVEGLESSLVCGLNNQFVYEVIYPYNNWAVITGVELYGDQFYGECYNIAPIKNSKVGDRVCIDRSSSGIAIKGWHYC